MEEDRDKVADMRERINEGEYRVEPEAVADAILRRLRDLAAVRQDRVAPGDWRWTAGTTFRASARIRTARRQSP